MQTFDVALARQFVRTGAGDDLLTQSKRACMNATRRSHGGKKDS
jgi:hypothetical protein